jgi:hypothetical protein
VLVLTAAALLAAAFLPGAATAEGAQRQLIGRVSSFQPYRLQLERGPLVVLHRGTVMRPTGFTPGAGMTVRVSGHRNGDGTFSADAVELLATPAPNAPAASYPPSSAAQPV